MVSHFIIVGLYTINCKIQAKIIINRIKSHLANPISPSRMLTQLEDILWIFFQMVQEIMNSMKNSKGN